MLQMTGIESGALAALYKDTDSGQVWSRRLGQNLSPSVTPRENLDYLIFQAVLPCSGLWTQLQRNLTMSIAEAIEKSVKAVFESYTIFGIHLETYTGERFKAKKYSTYKDSPSPACHICLPTDSTEGRWLLAECKEIWRGVPGPVLQGCPPQQAEAARGAPEAAESSRHGSAW